jgi:4-amino-4-deoxy-L-arabinose transferase-like glycosyltransferase
LACQFEIFNFQLLLAPKRPQILPIHRPPVNNTYAHPGPPGAVASARLGSDIGDPVVTCRHGVWQQRALCFVAAIAACKVALATVLLSAGIIHPFVGSNARDHYLPIAERLLTEGRFNGPESRADSKVPIGYPAILAAARWAWEEKQLQVAVWLQVLADCLTAFMLYLLAVAMGDPWAGLLGCLGWLLYPPAIVISTWVTAETLFTFLLVLSVTVLYLSLKRQRASVSFGGGVLLGAATLFRSTTLLLPLFFLPLWLLQRSRQGLWMGAAYFSGMLCLVAPWAVRNYVVLQDPIIVSVGIGSVFLQGSDARVFTFEGKHRHYPEMFAKAVDAGCATLGGDTESQEDKGLLQVGLYNYGERCRERPLSFVSFAGLKLIRMWYGTESGGTGVQWGLALCSLAIVPAGFWQIWRWRKTDQLLAGVMAALVLYFVALHFVTLPEYRYLHPVYPFLLLGACSWFVGRVRAWQ